MEAAAEAAPVGRAEMVAHYDGLAVGLARRFSSRRDTREDFIQVARLALIKAVDRFDPDRGPPFEVFARVTIDGELKRHVRDHTWRIKPPRSLQENYLAVVRTADDLTHELGRSPGIPELAERAGLGTDQVLEAMEVAYAGPLSLDYPLAGDDTAPLDPGTDDPGFALTEQRLFLAKAIARLPEREQRVLRLRFDDDLSQAQIAAQLGVSQMAVSRILARTLARLRIHLGAAAGLGGGRSSS